MRKKKLMVSVLAVVYFILSTACQKKASEEVDPGTFMGSEYHNNFFRMGITFPSDWSIQDLKSVQTLKNLDKQKINDNNRDLKAAIAASEFQTVRLFAVFKYPLGMPPFNPSLIGMAERVRHLPGIKSGKDYHYHTRKILESSQMKVRFPDPLDSETFDDVEFDVLYSETSLGSIVVKQNQYATVMKGYVLIFIATFATEDQEALLEDILETLTFN